MKNIKSLVVLVMLILICFVGVGCVEHEISEFKTYSNIYYKIEYPSNWQDPEIKDSKVLFKDSNNQSSLNIQEIFYEGSIEDFISKKDSIECVIDGVKGYEFKSKDNNDIYTLYLVSKNKMIFQLSFISQEDGDKSQDSIDQVIKSFKFNDFKSIGFGNWNKYSTESIEVYYPDNSNIYDEVEEWSKQREEAFNYITDYLDTQWNQEPIKMFVFNSQEHGKQYGIQLGFSLSELKQIYTLDIQYKGHELTHTITYHMNNGKRLDSALINEGIATFLDMSGRDFHRMAADLLKEKNYNISLLGDNFRKNENAYTYGASFVKYLIDDYGLDLFKEFYLQNKYNEEESFKRFYNKEGSILINEWIEQLKTY